MHTTGGYMVYAAMTHKYVFDYQPGDVYFCAADIGWVTGHSYIIYGPLANGATTVMFESTSRLSRREPLLADRRRSQASTSSTRRPPRSARLRARATSSSTSTLSPALRVLGTVGEPINPETWRGTSRRSATSRCAIVDTWWQTETGGILITPLPGITPLKPGSATLPFFGVKPVVVDPETARDRGQRRPGQCSASAEPGPARRARSTATTSASNETYFSMYPASTSPATAAGATRTATTGSPVASTTSSTSAVTAWAPPRSRAPSSPTRSSPRPRWSASRTRSRARASLPTSSSAPTRASTSRPSSSARSRSRSAT
jgi:acetyl-CoA synthetase